MMTSEAIHPHSTPRRRRCRWFVGVPQSTPVGTGLRICNAFAD